MAKVPKSWQTVGKGSQKLANSWQKFPIVDKQLAKAKVPDPVCTGATEERRNRGWQQISLSSSVKVREYPLTIYFLAEKLILQLVYLADNLQ